MRIPTKDSSMSHVHWLALTYVPGLGGATLRQLLGHFDSVEALLTAPPEALARFPRLRGETVAALQALNLDEAAQELSALTEGGVKLLTWDDPDYPVPLHDLSSPPPVLFVRGTLLPQDSQGVAIVGSRQAGETGVETAHHLARYLATAGLTVISGLALGVDTAAHQGALEAKEGRTVGVLGSGILRLHPRENVPLAEQITTRGAILSEWQPNAPPQGRFLMVRNRIVAALSHAVIVVEAGAKSGSLDTAQRARKLGRLVLACPGSPGTDALLQSRAATPLDISNTDLGALAERISQIEETPASPRQGRLF